MRPVPVSPPWDDRLSGGGPAGGIGRRIVRIGIPFEQRGIVHRRIPPDVFFAPGRRKRSFRASASLISLSTRRLLHAPRHPQPVYQLRSAGGLV